MDAKAVLEQVNLLLAAIYHEDLSAGVDALSKLNTAKDYSLNEYGAAINLISQVISNLSEQPEKEPNNGPQ